MRSMLPDVQAEVPGLRIGVDRVGLLWVSVPIASQRLSSDRYILQDVRFSVFVNLPPDQRGIHASRSYESILDAVAEVPLKGRLEDAAKKVATTLLERHGYASKSEVKVRAKLFRAVKTPVTGKESYEKTLVRGGAVATRTGGGIEVKRSLGVTVYGLTACPCAQRVVKAILEDSGETLKEEWMAATHMQRTLASADLWLVDGETFDLLELAEFAKAGLSSPVYDLLKRPDEAHLVMSVFRNTLFAEDAARLVASKIAKGASTLDPRTKLRVRIMSIESVHSHDFLAEIVSTLGDLRA